MKTEFGHQTELAKDFSATAQEISALYPERPKEFLFSGNSGSIYDFRNSEQRRKIGVPTDCGVVTNKNQEVMTTNVAGCAAVYLEGAESNAFFHLTPNSQLGYRYFKFNNSEELARNTSDKIVASLPQNENLSGMQGIIVVNIGSEAGGDFDYRKILADAKRLAVNLEKSGIRVKVVEIPLNNTSVYHTPEKPGKIFVCGVETSVNERGGLHVSNKTSGFWIDINSKQQAEYVKHSIIKQAA